MELRLTALLLITYSLIAFAAPQVVRIGGIYPITNIVTAQLNPIGAQWLAGSLLAMRDLNSDIAYTSQQISFRLAVRDSRKTFSNTVVGCLALAKSVFKNNGSQVIVGAGFNPVTEAMAYVFSDPQNNLAQIAYASNMSDLSHQSVFRDFLRTYPSSSYEGYALADTITNYFGYSRVVLIYTSDLYGTDGAVEFQTAAIQMNIEVVQAINFDLYETDFEPYLSGLGEYDARVFVLIISNLGQASGVMAYGAKSGLFNEKTIVFGTASMASPLLWHGMNAPSAAKMMKGFFVTSSADNDWKVTPRGLQFIKKYRSQPSTLGKIVNGVRVCNNQTDDDGGYMLYRASLTGSAPFNCVGFNFSAFSPDGHDIASYAPYAYDATVAAAVGVMTFGKIMNKGIIPHNINGIALKKVLINNVTFEGYSGKIAFSPGRPHIPHYGVGDRTAGVRFIVSNFNPGNGTLGGYSLARVGTWTTEGGFALCGDDPTLQSRVTGGCAAIQYGTEGNFPPQDRPTPIQLRMSNSIKAGLYFLACVTFCVVAFFMRVLFRFRKTRLLKASQPSMTWIIITANLFSVARIVLAGTDVTVATCTLDLWTGHLAFISVVAMFAKTLRIFIIIKSGLRRIKVTATHVLSFTAVWCTWWVTYLLFYTIFARSEIEDTRVVAITGLVTSTLSCTNSYPVLDTILYSFEGAFLCGSALLCYATKDVPDAINEAKVIALALTMIVVVCAVGFSLTTSLGLSQASRELVIGICFFVAGVGSMSLYFGNKTYLLLSGATLNAQFKIVRFNQKSDVSKQAGANAIYELDPSHNQVLMPNTISECESQISLLQGHLMVLIEKAVNLGGSRSESNGGRSRVHRVESPSGKHSPSDSAGGGGSIGYAQQYPVSNTSSEFADSKPADSKRKAKSGYFANHGPTTANSIDNEFPPSEPPSDYPVSEGAAKSLKIAPTTL